MAECSVCSHPEREELDAGLRAGLLKTKLASQHEVSRFALTRHESNGHVATALDLVTPTGDGATGGDLGGLEQEVRQLLVAAKESGSATQAIAAAKELRMLYAEKAKTNPGGVETVNYASDPAWLRTRQSIVDALDPFPDARQAVVAALAEVSA